MMQGFLSTRVRTMPASPASVLRRRAGELRRGGRSIIDLASGDLDFLTPEHVVDAARRAALSAPVKYSNVDGTIELKGAVQVDFHRRYGVRYELNEILVGNGSTQLLYNALLATLESDDEVIIPRPYWAPYAEQVRLAGGRAVFIDCAENNRFKLRPEELRQSMTARTRWLVLNNPVNPTGTLYSPAELSDIALVLKDYLGVWVLADGLYDSIVFDEHHVEALVAVAPFLRERVLTVHGVAKTYSMMGWRIGYAGGPASLVDAMARIQSQTTSGASAVSQRAAATALEGSQEFVEKRTIILESRRDRFVDLLNACQGLRCAPPQGTFYLFVSCAGVIGKTAPSGLVVATDRDFTAYLLEAHGVMVFAGADCGMSPFFRASFAPSPDLLDMAGQSIRAACAALL